MTQPCSRLSLSTDEAFKPHYDSEYEIYRPKLTSINALSSLLTSVTITLVLGIWCSDCKKHVPRFYKILDTIHFPEKAMQIICVDPDKTDDQGIAKSLGIQSVPTFIIYKNNNEIGRIIETPSLSLEEDLLNLLTSHAI